MRGVGAAGPPAVGASVHCHAQPWAPDACRRAGSRVEIDSLAGKRVAVGAPRPRRAARRDAADAACGAARRRRLHLARAVHQGTHAAAMRAAAASEPPAAPRQAMRDERTGEVVKNAHLLGFFRRITRLLCNRVRPVFVFDGATPALKRHTVAERRKRRQQADGRLRTVAEKLLFNRMRQFTALQARSARGWARRACGSRVRRTAEGQGRRCGGDRCALRRNRGAAAGRGGAGLRRRARRGRGGRVRAARGGGGRGRRRGRRVRRRRRRLRRRAAGAGGGRNGGHGGARRAADLAAAGVHPATPRAADGGEPAALRQGVGDGARRLLHRADGRLHRRRARQAAAHRARARRRRRAAARRAASAAHRR